jgi:hypothetical protein
LPCDGCSLVSPYTHQLDRGGHGAEKPGSEQGLRQLDVRTGFANSHLVIASPDRLRQSTHSFARAIVDADIAYKKADRIASLISLAVPRVNVRNTCPRPSYKKHRIMQMVDQDVVAGGKSHLSRPMQIKTYHHVT